MPLVDYLLVLGKKRGLSLIYIYIVLLAIVACSILWDRAKRQRPIVTLAPTKSVYQVKEDKIVIITVSNMSNYPIEIVDPECRAFGQISFYINGVDRTLKNNSTHYGVIDAEVSEVKLDSRAFRTMPINIHDYVGDLEPGEYKVNYSITLPFFPKPSSYLDVALYQIGYLFRNQVATYNNSILLIEDGELFALETDGGWSLQESVTTTGAFNITVTKNCGTIDEKENRGK